MPQLTLYRAQGACSLVPHILLTEHKIPFEEVLLVMDWEKGFYAADGSLTPEDYRKIHPSSYVPALKMDDEVLTETMALQTYISTFAPERNLLGKTPLEKARVAEWLSYISGSLHATAFAMIGRPLRYTDNKDHYESIQKKGSQKIREVLGEIDRRIAGREFAVGSADTVVDYYLFYFYYLLVERRTDGLVMTDYPNYRRVAKRVHAKEVVREVMEKEGVSLTLP